MIFKEIMGISLYFTFKSLPSFIECTGGDDDGLIAGGTLCIKRGHEIK
jgi:hypothetical protein